MEILGSMFPEMLSGQKFVDVTLAVEGRRIQCHRVILAAYSSYFSDLLEENPSQHPIIIFSSEIKFWMIQALVEFMYRGEVSVRQGDFGDLMKCAETLKIHGFIRAVLSHLENRESRNQGTESSSLPQQKTPAPQPEQVLMIDEIKTEVFDVEDTEISYPRELVRPENPPQEAENSGDSSLMNRSAESDPEILNSTHVERKKTKLRHWKTLENNRISGEMENENWSKDSEDETENSSRTERKKLKFHFGPPPEDFVLPRFNRQRSFTRTAMWSALMSVKNGMTLVRAAQKFKISNAVLCVYMKKYGIKSIYSHGRAKEECAETLKIQGFNRVVMSHLDNRESRNRRNESEGRLPKKEAARPEQVLIDKIKTEILDVEDTEIIYPRELVLPANPPQVPDNEPTREIRNSGESLVMNRSAEIVPEMVNSTHVERKKRNLRQRKTFQNYRISVKMKTGNSSMDSEDKAENSSWKKIKVDKLPFESSPKDFVLPPSNGKRSFDKNTMWSALMCVQNGMSAVQASKKFNISDRTLNGYMKKYGIKSRFRGRPEAL
ncbi:hypothetical protein DMENIID0001_136400 [Sergentomyia squamirostris]